MIQMPHADCRCADEPVEDQQQRGQDKDDADHADQCASSHEHTHGTDDVDVGVDCHAEGRREQAHAGDQDRRNGSGKGGQNRGLPIRSGNPLVLIARRHQDRVVDGGSELDRGDGDWRNKGQRTSQIMRQAQVDEDGDLDH